MKVDFRGSSYELEDVTAGRQIDVSSTLLSVTKGTINEMRVSEPETALLAEAQVYIMFYMPELSREMKGSLWEFSLEDAYEYVKMYTDIIRPKVQEETRKYRELFTAK